MYSLEQASWTGPRLLDGHDQHGVDAPFDVPSTYYKSVYSISQRL